MCGREGWGSPGQSCLLSSGEHVETGKSQTGGLGEDGLHKGGCDPAFPAPSTTTNTGNKCNKCRDMLISIIRGRFLTFLFMASLNWRTGLL